MNVCRHGLPVDPAGPFTLDQCRPCWRAGSVGETATDAMPCVHLGARVFVAGSGRDWRTCESPAQPLGPVVCPCKGCGPKCPGYAAPD